MEELPEWKKYVVVMIDEMKIKECLVYDKHSTHIIDIGDVGNQLNQLEEKYGCLDADAHVQHRLIATDMLILMVRAYFSRWSIRMPIFPRSVSRQHLCRVSCGKVSNALNFWA